MGRVLALLALLFSATPAAAGEVVGTLVAGGETRWQPSPAWPFLYLYRWRMDVHAYLPDRRAAGAPVVVLIPGCGQGWRDWLEGSGWREVAEARGAVLLLADFRDDFGGCEWWFDPRQRSTARGRQPELLARAVAEARRRFALGDGPNFAAGLSAGGAAAVGLLSLYPDLFAAGASVAGLPFACSGLAVGSRPSHHGVTCSTALFDELGKACACMAGAVDLDGAAWAAPVRALHPGRVAWPRLQVWQGTADDTVACRNAVELAEQWSALNGVAAPPADCAAGGHWAAGNRVEVRLIPGFGHFLPVAAGCGRDDPAHYLSVGAGVCAAAEMAAFFGL